MKVVKNDLFDYENRYIYQLEGAFKFSLDAILLAEFVKLKNKDKVVIDLCTGLAPIPLILTTRYNHEIIGIEIQKEVYDVAVSSVKMNALEKRIKLINDNIINIGKYFDKPEIDVLICNPPYFVNDLKSSTENKKISKHSEKIKLRDIFDIGKRNLKNNGRIYFSYRINRLNEIFEESKRSNFAIKTIVFIDTKNNLIPKLLLCEAVKNARSGLKVEIRQVKNLKTYKNLFKE